MTPRSEWLDNVIAGMRDSLAAFEGINGGPLRFPTDLVRDGIWLATHGPCEFFWFVYEYGTVIGTDQSATDAIAREWRLDKAAFLYYKFDLTGKRRPVFKPSPT
jgi:hypothetical protein